MIILMGLAGSGKSTQGKRLAEELDGVWLSAGQVLRDTNDPEVNAIQEQGGLVPDSLTIRLMTQAIAEAIVAGREVILDGYPRTVEQAEWIVENAIERIQAVVIIEVPKTELVKRLMKRGRSDDMSIEAIEERFRIVEQNIYSVCEILSEKGVRIAKIDGVGTEDEVAGRVKNVVTQNKEDNRGENE